METILKGERSFDKCAYKGCRNGRFNDRVQLFRFPKAEDATRFKAWIENCGNEKLKTYSATTIRRNGLCGKHFAMDNFTNSDRKRLKRTAIPNAYVAPIEPEIKETITTILEVPPSKKPEIIHNDKSNNVEPLRLSEVVTASNSFTCRTETVPSLPVATLSDRQSPYLREEIKTLKTELKLLRRENRTLLLQKARAHRRRQMASRKMSSRVLKRELKSIIERVNLAPAAKALISLQLHRPKAPFTEDEKTVAKNFYYYSPSGMKMLKQIGCNFPGESTIRDWLKEDGIGIGASDPVSQKCCKETKKLPLQEKICNLIMEKPDESMKADEEHE